jgi:hypothetical protein
MAGENIQQQMINNSIGQVYSFEEAIKFMKAFTVNPTTQSVNWVDSKTGKPVYIGYI